MVRSSLCAAAAALRTLLVATVPADAHSSQRRGAFDIEAHRGGVAYRPESTLSSLR
jgi:glycerophosphoryl diester phosphodiesterase